MPERFETRDLSEGLIAESCSYLALPGLEKVSGFHRNIAGTLNPNLLLGMLEFENGNQF